MIKIDRKTFTNQAPVKCLCNFKFDGNCHQFLRNSARVFERIFALRAFWQFRCDFGSIISSTLSKSMASKDEAKSPPHVPFSLPRFTRFAHYYYYLLLATFHNTIASLPLSPALFHHIFSSN